MFNESGRVDGGLYAKTDDYGSERLYGPKRYPVTLRMLSKEVDDVLFGGLPPLDVLTCRVPHCSMPAPRGSANACDNCIYMYDPQVATAYLKASLQARQAQGLIGCSTGPERRIFDHLWRGQEMLESDPATKGFKEKWGLVSDTSKEWKEVLHVDNWCDAQHVQRQGTSADELLVLSRHDEGRRIWPVAESALTKRSTGSSNAVKAANGRFLWSGAGFDLGLGMSATYTGPGEDRTALLAAAQSPSSMTPALSKAGTAVSAASSDKVTAGQVPSAKGPPAPKGSGTDSVKGPPAKPASDSAVMTSSMSKSSPSSPAIQGNFPTLAESIYGKIRSTEEVTSTESSKGSFDFLEPKGSFLLNIDCLHTRKGR